MYLSAWDASDISRTGYLQFNPGGPVILAGEHASGIALMGTNVGIGTTTPTRKLHVTGGDVYAPLTSDAVGTGSYGGSSFEIRNGTTSEDLNFDIFNRAISTWTTPLFIKNTGNVGIGTTVPDSRLTVNGTIHSKEVKVDLTGFPDYVFKHNYHLPNLTEVKNYIDKNHHLPDMPTEAEVARNGLKVGETEAMLTKKIEELTLYLIDLKKDNDELKKQVLILMKQKK